MAKPGSKITRSLALATAAFVSMPVAATAGKICDAMGRRAAPAGVRVRRAGPIPLRETAEITAAMWNAGTTAARVAVRILDVETGLRVDCVETSLKGGEGTHFSTKFAPEKGPTTLAARMWGLPEVGDEVVNLKKLGKPRILGTLRLLDDTNGAEKYIFSAKPGQG